MRADIAQRSCRECDRSVRHHSGFAAPSDNVVVVDGRAKESPELRGVRWLVAIPEDVGDKVGCNR